jgi:hypothetical protein
MKFLKRQFYELLLGVTAILMMGLLIIYVVLAMISVTSGISRTVGVTNGNDKTIMFDLEAAAALNFD